MDGAKPGPANNINMELDDHTLETSTSTCLEGWSKEDKFELLEALRTCATDDITQILPYLPNKTADDIKLAIDYYNQKALKLKPKANIEKPKENKGPTTPLAQWAELLTNNFTFSELNTDIATAIRLIANYEHIPPSVTTENIDFRKIYHVIANAIEGKPLPQDTSIIDVLNKCLIETALTSKVFMKQSTLRNVISQIDVSARDTHIFPKPTAENEAACIKHLGSQITYNPLNISENLLKINNNKV